MPLNRFLRLQRKRAPDSNSAISAELDRSSDTTGPIAAPLPPLVVPTTHVSAPMPPVQPPRPSAPPQLIPTQVVAAPAPTEPGALKPWVANPPFAFRRSELFSPGECADILALHTGLTVTEQHLGDWRAHHAFWVSEHENTAWIFDRLRMGLAEYNEGYGLELTDDPGALQLTRYRPGHHYNWHMDLGGGAKSLRKVSISVELSSGYEGGGLEIFYWHSGPMQVRLAPGDALIYPAFAVHRVPAIRLGERWSLVAWFCGPRPLR